MGFNTYGLYHFSFSMKERFVRTASHANVAYVLGYLAKRYGGPPNMAIHIGQTIAKYGITSTWWATATDEEKEELAYLGKSAYLFNPSFPRNWHRSGALPRKLAINNNNIDLYHLNQIWDYPVYAGARLPEKVISPYIVTPHGIFSQPWRYGGLKKRLYLRLVAMPLLNHAACVHAVAEEELQGFAEVGIKVPYTVVPNGVDPIEYSDLP